MRITWLAVFAAAGYIASPGVAVGAPTGKIKGVVGDPVLAGDQALWLLGHRGGGFDLWSGAPREPIRRIQRFPFRPSDEFKRDGYLVGSVAASPALALVSTYGYEYAGDRSGGYDPTFGEHYLGPPGGPLRRIMRCARERDVGMRSADVWGAAYAYRQCDEAAGHVEIRDAAAAPLSPARSVGRGGYSVRIAGRYVAWLDTPHEVSGCPGDFELVVYDRVADAEVYRVPNAEMAGRVNSLDVQEDGKAVIVFEPGPCSPIEVAWISPQEPYLHRLPLERRDHYQVKMANDQIAFQRGDQVLADSVPDAEVGISDLAGNVRIVARHTDVFRGVDSFDFDGERLAWREFGCEERRVVIRRADKPGEAPGGGTNCRARLLRRPVVSGRGVAELWFGCGAFSKPCGFQAELRRPGRNGAPVGRTPDSYPPNPVRVKLRRAAWRLLKRRGSLRVKATVTLVDQAARQQTRRATIRLKAPSS